MPVTGRLFKITQLDRFVASYLADPSRPIRPPSSRSATPASGC